MKRLGLPDLEGDRLAALGACWLTVSWAVAHFYDLYTARHWWAAPILVLGAVAVAAILMNRTAGPPLALLAGLTAGLAEHLWRTPVSQSDVIASIQEAVRLLLAGQNPYGIPLTSTNPPGAVYLYPPGPLLLYGPLLDLTETALERISSLAIIVLLASLAWWIGAGRAALAVTLYGTYLYGSFSAIDSSNDTTLALLLVLGIVLLWHSQRGGPLARWTFWSAAPVFALALLFKQSGWPVYAFIALHLWRDHPDGRRHVLTTAAIAAAVMLPFLLTAPVQFVSAVAFPLTGHKNIYGLNVLGTLAMLAPAAAEAIRPFNVLLALAGVAAVSLLFFRRRARTLAASVAQGAAVYFAAAILLGWTSPAHFMVLGTLLCLLLALTPLSSRGSEAKTMA